MAIRISVRRVKPQTIILPIAALLIGFLLAWLFKPVDKPEILGDLTRSQESELKANIVTLEGQNDSLRTELGKSKADGIEAATAFKTAIGSHRKEIARLKSLPAVVEIVEANPALDSLHKAYDSALTAYERRVVDLIDELQLRDKINLQISQNFEARLSAAEQLLHEKTIENEQLAAQNKKLRRGRVLRNVLLPAAIVGSFILGAVAVD